MVRTPKRVGRVKSTGDEIEYMLVTEAKEFLEKERPEGSPLKDASSIYMFLHIHESDKYRPIWFSERDGPNGFARYLDEQIAKARYGVIEISEDGDFARNDDRVEIYRKKLTEQYTYHEKSGDGTTVEKTAKVDMRFMLNFDAGWQSMMQNVRRLQGVGAEIRHFVPTKPYDNSTFGVIDEELFFCITRQPSPGSDVQKICGESQPEKAPQPDVISGERREMMNYTMVTTEHPGFVESALEILEDWWEKATTAEAAEARLEAFYRNRNIVNDKNGTQNGKTIP